jgi:hypothetical protein
MKEMGKGIATIGIWVAVAAICIKEPVSILLVPLAGMGATFFIWG